MSNYGGYNMPNWKAMAQADANADVRRTEGHTRVTADAMVELVEAMQKSLELSEEMRAGTERVERFTRRMSVASFWVAAASLAAAIGSLVLAALALATAAG